MFDPKSLKRSRPLAFSSSTTTAYSAYRHETETDSSGAPLLLWRATQNRNTPHWNLNLLLLMLLTGAPCERFSPALWLLCSKDLTISFCEPFFIVCFHPYLIPCVFAYSVFKSPVCFFSGLSLKGDCLHSSLCNCCCDNKLLSMHCLSGVTYSCHINSFFKTLSWPLNCKTFF